MGIEVTANCHNIGEYDGFAPAWAWIRTLPAHNDEMIFEFFAKRSLKKRALEHAGRLLGAVSDIPHPGDIYLAGGAFKPLMGSSKPVRDLDLWVKNRWAREAAAAWLLDSGFILERDFQPYCQVFRKDGQVVELTYQNLKEGGIQDVIEFFDLGTSQIAVKVTNGRACEIFTTPDFWESQQSRIVRISRSHWHRLGNEHSPTMVLSLHRMESCAAELGWDYDRSQQDEMWRMLAEDYTVEEATGALALADEILGEYKNHSEAPSLVRARIEVAKKAAMHPTDPNSAE